MTNEEALLYFKDEMQDGKCNDGCKLCDAMLVAIDVLEKQIPKKPTGDLHSCPHYRCPVCKKGVKMYEDSFTFPFCHHCGQALYWR